MGIAFIDPVDENEVRRREVVKSGNIGDDVIMLEGEDDK
jgi:hypothetical protein